jgi:hypothetical protein
VDLCAPYKFRLYDLDFLYKTIQIFTWCKNSEVKVKISRAILKHTKLLRWHTARHTAQRSIDRHSNCLVAIAIARVLLQLSSLPF